MGKKGQKTKQQLRDEAQRDRKKQGKAKKRKANQAQVQGSKRDFNSTDTRPSSQKTNRYKEMKKKTTAEVGTGQLNSAFKACQDLIGKGQIIPADMRGQLSPMERRALSVQAQTSGQYKINGISEEALAKRPAPKPSTNAQKYTK